MIPKSLHGAVLALMLSACSTPPALPAKAGSVPTVPASPVAAVQPGGSPFNQTLALQGITFQVTSANSSSVNRLSIRPSGLKVDNTPIDREIDGTVTGAEVADLNVDGSPELYVYVNSAGSGSYGSLVAYAANKLKSLSEIYLPPLTDDKEASQGYMGHDEFRVVENVLVRRFPVYRDQDSNAKPTGGIRQVQYKLVPGEAGWILRADKTIDY